MRQNNLVFVLIEGNESNMQKPVKITDSEKQVLDLLWDQETPLTSTEIVHLSKDRTWKPSYIHIMISSLLKKEMIRVASFKKTTKNYARAFEPTMTREEWNLLQVTQQQKSASRTLSQVFTALLKEATSSDLLDDLSEMLDARKKELDEQERSDS